MVDTQISWELPHGLSKMIITLCKRVGNTLR